MPKRLLATVSTLALTAGAFAVLGGVAPAANAGLLCSTFENTSADYARTQCRGYSGNDYRQVRAVAYCRSRDLEPVTRAAYGPWVNGSSSTSTAHCRNGWNLRSSTVQYR
jgi:hypothetical protein